MLIGHKAFKEFRACVARALHVSPTHPERALIAQKTLGTSKSFLMIPPENDICKIF